jgi:hypothetical protein
MSCEKIIVVNMIIIISSFLEINLLNYYLLPHVHHLMDNPCLNVTQKISMLICLSKFQNVITKYFIITI